MTKPTKSVPIGPLSRKSTGNRHWVEPKREFPLPSKHCNAVMREPLVLDKLWVSPARPGADHSHLQSKGQGC